MPIPPLNHRGQLPEGIHDCTVEEIEARFGSVQGSDRRLRLWAKFREFVREIRACGDVLAILLNGSFVTANSSPNDIDLILVLPPDWDLEADLSPNRYNLLSRKRVQNRFSFDMLVAREYSKQYTEYVALFQGVRGRERWRKGILRIRL